jgi:hypothetical protein
MEWWEWCWIGAGVLLSIPAVGMMLVPTAEPGTSDIAC